MIKARIKYLITLCILLLSISGQLDAHTLRKGAFHHPIKKHRASLDGNLQNNVSHTFTSVSLDSGENILFDYNEEVEEDEEDGIVSQKKNLENTDVSSTLFYSWYSKFFLLTNAKVLHFSKHLSNFSYHKLFIVFQVFRI
ncbi:MAG: hypothetical protein V4585_10745 [Bacteroidota bacterium]|jgi:hypothetical protein